MPQSESPGRTAYVRLVADAGDGAGAGLCTVAVMADRDEGAGGVLAPAFTERARGAPNVVQASTPNAMRAASRSRTDEPWRNPTSPLRTCATTARSSCAQQAAQATQAATTRRHSASRGMGRQACPSPPASGLPTITTSTAGTAVNANKVATAAPTTSRIRCGLPTWVLLPTCRADGDGVGQGRRLRRGLAHRGQTASAGGRQRRSHGRGPAHALAPARARDLHGEVGVPRPHHRDLHGARPGESESPRGLERGVEVALGLRAVGRHKGCGGRGRGRRR